MRRVNLIPLILVIIAIIGMALNWLNTGIWFQFDDLHHETFVIALLACAVFIYAALQGWFAIFRVALRF